MGQIITPDDIAAIVRADLSDDPYVGDMIDQLEALVAIEVGDLEVANPSPKLRAAVAQIAVRMWRAGKTAEAAPEMVTGESIGGYSYTATAQVGLGLTNSERELLRRAVGRNGLWVQPTTREDPAGTITDQFVPDASGGDPILYYAADDLPPGT